LNPRIAKLIGQPPVKLDPAGVFLAKALPEVVLAYVRSQPESLDEDTLRVETVRDGDVVFLVDGYASDHEATKILPVTVRGTYRVETQQVQRET
jgi:hypothetical protein